MARGDLNPRFEARPSGPASGCLMIVGGEWKCFWLAMQSLSEAKSCGPRDKRPWWTDPHLRNRSLVLTGDPE